MYGTKEPKVFRTAKLSESNASAPTNKPPKNGLGNWNVIWKRGVTTMRALTIVLSKQVVLTEKTSSNIKKRTRTTECHLSSHTILCSVIYPASFVSTGQPYKNTQNCVKSSQNHPSWPSGNPKVWKTCGWELTSPLDLPTMVSVKNVTRDDVWLAKTSNAHKNSAAHTQEKNSFYTAMPTARQKILSTSWNVQFVVFNTSEKLNNNLVNAWMATEAMQIANLTFHSADISDRRATMILLANWRSPLLTITPSGMIKADRKGKASGLENLRPYHRMESMRKSNILSWLLFVLISSSRFRTYSLLYWPKVYIPDCGGPLFWMSLGIIPFSTIFWQCYFIHLPIMSHFYIYFYF